MSFRPEEETLAMLQLSPTLAETRAGRIAMRNGVIFMMKFALRFRVSHLVGADGTSEE